MAKQAVPSEPMLYGYPKYEVEGLADTIMRAREAESTQPGLYKAAMKLLAKRHSTLSAVVRAVAGKGK